MKGRRFNVGTLLILVTLSSCSFSAKTLRNGDTWIPNDFNPKNTILLVEEWYGRKKDKAIEQQINYMDEKYPYKYEVVPLSKIKNKEGKYANTKLYKYALVSSRTTTPLTKAQGASTNTGALNDVSVDFRFFDRENDKNYRTTHRSQGPFKQTFQVVVNTIAKKFEGS